jgi:hypothetical protein
MPKFNWIETFQTSAKYSAEITEEQAKLFKENPEEFFETVDYQGYKNLEWDEISGEEELEHAIED